MQEIDGPLHGQTPTTVCNMIHVPGPPCAPCIRLYFTVTLVLSRKCRLTEFVRKLPSDLNYNMINVSLLQGLKKMTVFSRR